MNINQIQRIALLFLMLVFLSILSSAEERIKMTLESGVYTVPCEVNGLKLKFVFDTGASDVHLSLIEAAFMLKNGYISPDDILGTDSYSMADGSIAENALVILKEIKIGHIVITDVRACVSSNIDASLLLGQSAIRKIGKYTIDNDFLVLHDSDPGNDKQDTNVDYEGGIQDGVAHGNGTMKYNNGDKYDGQWVNGKRQGQGTYTFINGDKYVGNWINNQQNGYGVYYFADGSKYIGHWNNNKQDGRGLNIWANGDRYEGYFKDGLLDGEGTITWNSGVKFVGKWIKGIQSGYGTYYYPDGKKQDGYWENYNPVSSLSNGSGGVSDRDVTKSYEEKSTTSYSEQRFYLAQTSIALNLRDGPSTEYKVLAKMPKGSTVFVTIDSDDDFVRVLYLEKDIYGYVSKKYLTGFEEIEIDNTGRFSVVGKSEYLDKAEIEIENGTSRNVSINVGKMTYKFSAHEKRIIRLSSGTYNITASSTGLIPYVGRYSVVGGNKYSWYFFIKNI